MTLAVVRRAARGDARALGAGLHPVLRRVYVGRGLCDPAELRLTLDRLLPVLQRVPATWLLLGYVGYTQAARAAGLQLGNTLALPVFLPLTFLVVRAAFSGLRDVSERLRKNDVSYGVYIFHMPFVNQMLFYERSGVGALLGALAATLAAATLSWLLVEKPCLRFKKHPMHSVEA